MPLTFVVADYINKPGAIFLDKSESIIKFLENSFTSSRYNFLLPPYFVLVRIELQDNESTFIKHRIEKISESSSIHTFSSPLYMDEPSLRPFFYKYIGRRILEARG